MKSCLFQDMESSLGSAIQKANQVLGASTCGDAIPAAALQRAADELQETVKSVVSCGLEKSHALVVKATKLGKSLGNQGSRIKVSALHVVFMFE